MLSLRDYSDAELNAELTRARREELHAGHARDIQGIEVWHAREDQVLDEIATRRRHRITHEREQARAILAAQGIT